MNRDEIANEIFRLFNLLVEADATYAMGLANEIKLSIDGSFVHVSQGKQYWDNPRRKATPSLDDAYSVHQNTGFERK